MVDGDDELGVGVFDLLGELCGGVERVRGGENGADGGDGEETEREVVGVGGEDQDDVVLADAEAEEAVGESGDGGFELGEG